MIKKIIFLIPLIASSLCFANTEVEVRYMGYIFKIPENPSIVATSGDENSTLIFKYGEPHGTESVVFSDSDNDPVLKDLIKGEGCTYKVFLNELFGQAKNTVCDQELLIPFGRLLFQDSEYGIWPSVEDFKMYYIIGPDRSSVIITGVDKKSIKIETGFLNKEQLREVVSNYLQ